MAEVQPTFVIVGAGQAGAWVARTLRSERFAGRIVLVGSERHWPYERPPLSKGVLTGAAVGAGSALLNQTQAEDQAIEVWLGETATAIDPGARTLICASGRRLAYDKLFLTTGAIPRAPPWLADLGSPRVHRLRTADEAERLRERLTQTRKLLVLGGGWIGLEVAATARGLGVEVTLVEAAPRLCARSTPPTVSDYLKALHETRGVRVVLGAACQGLEVDADGVSVKLADGTSLEADDLVFGIGVTPDTRLAVDAGLAVDDGVLVDLTGRTSDSNIYAAGDAARRRDLTTGLDSRLESWQNAQNQAIVAAKASLGQAAVHDETPWAWSDQYDLNIQLLGSPERGALVVFRRGSADGAGCWLAYDTAGAVVGAISVDAPRELRAVRKALQQRMSPSPEAWSDLSQPCDRLVLRANA